MWRGFFYESAVSLTRDRVVNRQRLLFANGTTAGEGPTRAANMPNSESSESAAVVHEVSLIFARGILRARKRLPPEPEKSPPEILAQGLELLPETRLTVLAVNGPGDPDNKEPKQ